MKSGDRLGSKIFRPLAERMECRLVMSSHASVAAEVQAILKASVGATPVRPNTPVLPLESPYATATFIDPSARIVQGKLAAVGQKDYIAPYATLNSTHGYIKIGSSSTVQDNATIVASTAKTPGITGVFIGDNVVVGTGAKVIGPAAIGTIGGAATSIGSGAVIDGAIIKPGALVGALATVGPGVTLPTGYRVLPGKDVTNDAEASTPSMGYVVAVASTDMASAKAVIADNVALALGYATLYQGNSATGGAASAGPIPTAISASGSTIYFGGLNSVLGISSEPGSTRGVAFEPATGTSPTFTDIVTPNDSYRFATRIIGQVNFGETATRVLDALGSGDSIRADEGQPIKIVSIARLGNHVSIHAPQGSLQGITVTSVVTTTTIVATGVTTSTTNITTLTSPGTPTATAGTTFVSTSGTNAAGQATVGTVTTSIATRTLNQGAITIGENFTALDNATILGGPNVGTTIGDDVTVGNNAVVSTSTIGNGVIIGSGAYVIGSTVAAGTVIPNGLIFINNMIMGFVQP